MVKCMAKVTVRVNGFEQEYISTVLRVLDFSRRGEELVNSGCFTSVEKNSFIASFIKQIGGFKYPED